MAKSSNAPKKRRGKKPSMAEQKKLTDAVALVKANYADVLSVWGQATDAQKQAYLANSPLLAELVGWAALWQR